MQSVDGFSLDEDRSVRTQTEAIIATVDDRPISIDYLFQFLRLTLNWTIVDSLMERTLIEKAFAENGISVPEEELIAFVEKYRADRGLLTAAETEKWLEDNKLTADELYDLCEFELKEEQLKNSLFTDDDIRARFVLSRGDFETVELYQIVIGKESKAKEIAALIHDGKSFFELARQHSEEDATRKVCGYTGKVVRTSIRPELESRIYGASEGDIIGPIKSLGSHHIVLVEKFHHVEFTPQIQEEIRAILYRGWRQERLQMADVDLSV